MGYQRLIPISAHNLPMNLAASSDRCADRCPIWGNEIWNSYSKKLNVNRYNVVTSIKGWSTGGE